MPPQPENYHFQFRSIPEHAWGDIKNTFWGYNALYLGLGTAASLAFLSADDSIDNHFAAHQKFSQKFDSNLGWVVSPYTLGGASIVAFLIGTQVDNPKFSLAAETSVESWVMTMAITAGLKYSIGRTRPNGQNYSMPSAHAAAAFSMATVLTEYYGLKAAIPGYAVAGLVSFSRLDGHYHHLSDVLLGSAIGTVVGLGTSQFHKKAHASYLIAPQISSHGSNISVYKTF